MINFDIAQFINTEITGREKSFFREDIIRNTGRLTEQIAGKSVLVIGGGGTIGASFIKAILRFSPARVVVIDSNENGLTELTRDVRSSAGLPVPAEFITYPVNLGDRIFTKIYEHYRPFDIIANFAAHKHVRSEKDVFSVEAMIQNNLFYAYQLLQLIENDNPAHFFCVSTDKAANPVNIMGASKKLMEEVVMQFAESVPCTTARFANVAFSNGSLLDGFNQRLMKRQPLSVPSDVKRYFVSPEEAGEICMLACVLGETGDIYFPKLKPEQLTGFLGIAERYLDRFGFAMDVCKSEAEAKEKAAGLNNSSTSYPVYVFQSETTGEKLFEEFYTDTEIVDWDSYLALGIIKKDVSQSIGDVAAAITDLKELFDSPLAGKAEVVRVLQKHLPSFSHAEKGVTLDSKM